MGANWVAESHSMVNGAAPEAVGTSLVVLWPVIGINKFVTIELTFVIKPPGRAEFSQAVEPVSHLMSLMSIVSKHVN